MARIYIKSNKYLLQKFDKGHSVPVGMAALKNLGSKKDEIPSLLDKDDELNSDDDLFEKISQMAAVNPTMPLGDFDKLINKKLK